MARLPDTPEGWAIALAFTAVVMVLVVAFVVPWQRRRMRVLAADLEARGFRSDGPPSFRYHQDDALVCTLTGTWRGRDARIAYSGNKTGWFTVVQLGTARRRLPGATADAAAVAEALDALAAEFADAAR